MSKYYALRVSVMGITEEELSRVMEEELLLRRYESWTDGPVLCAEYEGFIWAYTEKEAHNDIVESLRAINPNAKVLTRWTYLEDLPYEEYGDFDIYDQELKGGDG